MSSSMTRFSLFHVSPEDGRERRMALALASRGHGQADVGHFGLARIELLREIYNPCHADEVDIRINEEVEVGVIEGATLHPIVPAPSTIGETALAFRNSVRGGRPIFQRRRQARPPAGAFTSEFRKLGPECEAPAVNIRHVIPVVDVFEIELPVIAPRKVCKERFVIDMFEISSSRARNYYETDRKLVVDPGRD
jgi:hypothetical protein